MNYILNNKIKCAIIGVVGLITVGISFIMLCNQNEKDSVQEFESIIVAENIDSSIIEDNDNSFYVDIKGAVKKPGVYKMEKGSIVNDLITKAGGLTSNGSTQNINLSQELSKQMVVYIFTKNELKSESVKTNTTCTTQVIEVNKCEVPTTTKIIEQEDDNISNSSEDSNQADDNNTSSDSNTLTNSLININTASLTDLITIPGIGESKAKSIIEYRQTKLFASIDEIKNVSGIGDALFAKIKDYITV